MRRVTAEMLPGDRARTVDAPAVSPVAGGGALARWRTVVIVVATTLAALAASQAIEWFINRIVRPNAEELTWISESIMTAGFLVMTAIWMRLRRTQAELSTSERQRVAVATELAVAADVQRALLPQVPGPTNGVQWSARTEPAGEVGGDYYDFQALADGRMCVVLGDVSGKGVPAAVFLSNVRAIIRALLRETTSPAEVLSRLSETLFQDVGGRLYMTCALGVVDSVARTLTYANAGHPPGLLLGRGGTRGLTVGGPPVGLFPATPFGEAVVPLVEGDLVVWVSDGVTDALDVGGDAVPATLAAIITREGATNPDMASDALLRAGRDGRGPQGVPGWSDDRTVVAFGIPSY